jgi:DNA gyrase subunit A
VIAVIKAASTPAEAKAGLVARAWPGGAVPEMLSRAEGVRVRPDGLAAEFGLGEQGYRLSEVQAQAILDLRLHRLTGLERGKIVAEYAEILARITDLSDILARPARLLEVIRGELLAVRAEFADPRRTEIIVDHSDLTMEDLIEDQPVVVTLTSDGYVKTQPVTEYRSQNRGGRGKAATEMKQEDLIERLFVANTHDTLLCFSNRGRVYWLKVYKLPLAQGRGGRGKPIVNLLALEDGERINAMLPIREFPEDRFVFMATGQGTVKKTPLEAFSRPRTAGIIAITLDEGDRLVGVDITDGHSEVMLTTTGGKAIRFAEDDVRPMGREAAGVRGIAVTDGHEVNSLIVLREGVILTVSENGYGKLTEALEFPLHGRGGQGVIALQLSERNGRMVGAMQVQASDDVMLISEGGTLVRTAVAQVSTLSRNTQGVRLMRVDDADRVVGMARVEHINGEDDESLVDVVATDIPTDVPAPEGAVEGENGPPDAV